MVLFNSQVRSPGRDGERGEQKMDIYEAFKRENAKLARVLAKLIDSSAGRSTEREQYLEQIELLLDCQWRLEENYLYPVLDAFTDSRRAVEKARNENRVIGRILKELRSIDSSDPGFRYAAERLQSEAVTHMDWEQKELLDMLRQKIPQEQAQLLGQRAAEEILA